MLEKKTKEDSEIVRSDVDGANEIKVEQEVKKTQEQKEEDNQEALEVAQIMKELEKEK